MKKTVFGIVGAGWRAEFYLRIAAALPERFAVSGIYVRRPDRAEELARKGYGALVCHTREELLSRPFDFLVCAVRSAEGMSTAAALAAAGAPVLLETPAATSLAQLREEESLLPAGVRVAVAEQFLCQPYFAALRRIISLGLIGEVHYLRLSAAHDYHGISLARGLLGTGLRMPDRIRSALLSDPVLQTRGRPGRLPGREVLSRQRLTVLTFGDKTALLDFSGEQYFSPIRTGEVLVRGTRGEIHGDTLRYLTANEDPVTLPISRIEYGKGTNLDGYALEAITAGEQILYRNPFPLARLSDEEIAIAHTLLHMADYAGGAAATVYSLEEARLDCRIAWEAAENAPLFD